MDVRAAVAVAAGKPLEIMTVQLEGRQVMDAGWQLPRILWRDGDTLVVQGSAAFDRDASLHALDLQLHSADVAPLRERYLSGWLGLAGLADLQLSGAADATVRMVDGRLASAGANLRGIDLVDPQGRFRFDDLSGAPRFSANAPVSGELRWRSGQLYGLDFGAAALPIDSQDGVIQLRDMVTVPMLGGSLRFDRMAIRPPAGEAGAEIDFGLTLDQLDIGAWRRRGLPAFRGSLEWAIPSALCNEPWISTAPCRCACSTAASVSELSMERPSAWRRACPPMC